MSDESATFLRLVAKNQDGCISEHSIINATSKSVIYKLIIIFKFNINKVREQIHSTQLLRL